MTYDYIFCPLCGASKWLTNKTMSDARGRLTEYKCGGCKKFTYTNISMLVEHPILIGVTQTVRYKVMAQIDPYNIVVHYLDNITEFYHLDDRKMVLSLNQAVTFNWYKNEELISKIKKYVVFS